MNMSASDLHPEVEFYDECYEREEDEYDPGEDCGRWDQNAKGGMLPYYWCRLAGTEFCDWECPFSRSR